MATRLLPCTHLIIAADYRDSTFLVKALSPFCIESDSVLCIGLVFAIAPKRSSLSTLHIWIWQICKKLSRNRLLGIPKNYYVDTDRDGYLHGYRNRLYLFRLFFSEILRWIGATILYFGVTRHIDQNECLEGGT